MQATLQEKFCPELLPFRNTEYDHLVKELAAH